MTSGPATQVLAAAWLAQGSKSWGISLVVGILCADFVRGVADYPRHVCVGVQCTAVYHPARMGWVVQAVFDVAPPGDPRPVIGDVQEHLLAVLAPFAFD